MRVCVCLWVMTERMMVSLVISISNNCLPDAGSGAAPVGAVVGFPRPGEFSGAFTACTYVYYTQLLSSTMHLLTGC